MTTKKITLAICLFLGAQLANAASINLTNSTTWSAITTGSGVGGNPSSSDVVTVHGGATLTVDVSNAACNTINLGTTAGGSGDAGVLVFSMNTSQLTTTTANLGSSNTNGKLDFTNGGKIISATINNTGASSNAYILPTTPTQGTIELNGTQTLNLGTNALQFPSLNINGGNITLGRSITVNGNLQILNGTLTNTTFSQTVTGNFVNAGTFVAGTSNYTLSGSSKTISGSSATTFATLTVSGSYTNNLSGILTVATSLAGSGSFTQAANTSLYISGTSPITTLNATATENTVRYNGSSAQTTSSVASYYNLKIANSSGVSSSVNTSLIGVLTLSNGTFNLNGHTFTLLSTATQTAAVAPLGSGAISGNITVQRYSPAGTTGWTWVGSPVVGATIADWQGEFYTCGFSGASGSAGGFVSIYSYNEAATGPYSSGSSYVAPSSASDILQNGRGYWVYLGTGANTSNSITFDVTGALPTGSVALPVLYTNTGNPLEDGWNLVANPYPCTINWAATGGAWSKSNMEEFIQIYDVDINNYATYSTSLNDSTNGGSRYIAASQGFYVKATNDYPFLVVTESAKAPTKQPNFKSNSNIKSNTSINLRMKITESGSSITDECIVAFKDGTSNSYELGVDLDKLFPSTTAPCVNIYTISDNHKLTINCIGQLEESFQLPIEVTVPGNGSYNINFSNVENLIAEYSQFFDDNYLVVENVATGVIIPLTSSSDMDFLVDNNDSTIQFILHFSNPVINGLSTKEVFNVMQIKKTQDGYTAYFDLNEPSNTIIQIYNMLGQPVKPIITELVSKSNVKLNTNNLPSGPYLIQVNYSGKTVSKKIIL